jgi:DNA invertase Pin-like site-specific DNA recombinase
MNPRAVIWASVSTEEQAVEEKDSIPMQLKNARDLCASEHWDIVAELIVPGHSRNYIKFDSLARDARNSSPPITAFDELNELWESKGMDILIVRDGSRFARTQALHGYFVDMTIITCGARIYSFSDGMIDERNAPMFHSMSSYRSVVERQQLVARHKWGMNRRAERGLPPNRAAVFSHRIVRDSLGKAVRVEVRTELRTLFNDLEKVLLSGVAWSDIEAELFNLGHSNRNGNPYSARKFYYLLHNPYFWGNAGVNYYNEYGSWAFDPDSPAPEAATIYRNTHEAVYTGVQADKVIAEIRRRARESGIVVGSAKPATPYWFSGLVICDQCKYKTSATAGGKYIRCRTHASLQPEACDQSKHIHRRDLQHYVDSWLRQLLAADDLEAFFAAGDEDHAANLLQLRQKEIQLRDHMLYINTIIDDRLNARTLEVREIYTRKLTDAETHLDSLKTEIAALRQRAEQADKPANRKRTLDELAAIGLKNFWSLPPHRINQVLHSLLGHWRFRMRDGELIGRTRSYNNYHTRWDARQS